MISIRNLHIGYSSPLLHINEIDLNLGELYILMGKNGSGKSTFIKTLTKQIALLSGTIQLGKKSIENYSTNELPQLISFVGTRFSEVDYLLVEDYISLGRNPYTNNFGKLKDKDKSAIEAAIEVMEIKHLLNRFTSDLSDGERQMISIAKSLAQDTKIIVLDEPTAFLDYTNKTRLLEKLKSISQKLNKCIILSSHDVDLSLSIDSEYLIVNNGRIDLFSNGLEKKELIGLAY